MILKIIFTKVFSQFSEKQTIHPINITSIYEVHIFAWLTPSIFRSLIPNSPSWNHEKHVMETWISYDISWWKIMMKNHDFRIVSSIFHPKSSKHLSFPPWDQDADRLGPARESGNPRLRRPHGSLCPAWIAWPLRVGIDQIGTEGYWRNGRSNKYQRLELYGIYDIWYNPNISQ